MDGNTPSPRLLDQVRDLLRTKHYSIRTETQYLQWIRRFILFHGKKHPREMGRRTCGGISDASGGAETGGRLDAESGVVGFAVPVSGMC